MRWIVLSSPSCNEGEPSFKHDEISFIHRLFDAGVDAFHLRKPGASKSQLRAFLLSLSHEERSKTVLHQHYDLSTEFQLKGLHLKSSSDMELCTSLRKAGHGISRSCHSLQEVAQYKSLCDYLFLSPIFDSLSKQNYASAFSDELLHKASRSGLIDEKVIALGGIAPRHLPYLKDLGFGGAAMLGHIDDLRSLPVGEQARHLREIKQIFNDLSQ